MRHFLVTAKAGNTTKALAFDIREISKPMPVTGEGLIISQESAPDVDQIAQAFLDRAKAKDEGAAMHTQAAEIMGALPYGMRLLYAPVTDKIAEALKAGDKASALLILETTPSFGDKDVETMLKQLLALFA